MLRRLSVTLLLACWAFLPAGCGRGTTPEENPANRADVTLHVPDMTERQGLT